MPPPGRMFAFVYLHSERGSDSFNRSTWTVGQWTYVCVRTPQKKEIVCVVGWSKHPQPTHHSLQGKKVFEDFVHEATTEKLWHRRRMNVERERTLVSQECLRHELVTGLRWLTILLHYLAIDLVCSSLVAASRGFWSDWLVVVAHH